MLRLSILGHASVLVEAGDQRVLVDPLFAQTFAQGVIGFHPARAIHRNLMPDPTAIVVTHLHLDHWHPATLAEFDRATPIVCADDAFLQGRLTELGFGDVTVAVPWQPIDLGELRLVPTPSKGEIEEFGVVFRHGEAAYWHVSDSMVGPADGTRVAADHGPIAVVAARYQPITPLVSYQRGLGMGHDERDGIVAWLEAACAADPSFVFPYFCDIDYVGDHRWANRWARPFSPHEIADLLRRRLADLPAERAVQVVSPGDVIEMAQWGEVSHSPGAAAFVEPLASRPEAFEPVDTATLFGVETSADRDDLRNRFGRWLAEEYLPWLAELFAIPGMPVHRLVAMQVVWQVVVHAGAGERIAYHLDFRKPQISLTAGEHPHANYAVHLSGRALLTVLRGEGGGELFWLAGASRFYEKILYVADGRIQAPPERGWDLFEAVPEPLSWCLRKHGVHPGL